MHGLPEHRESRSSRSGPVKRNEDPRLLRGLGAFVDDIDPPGVLHAAIMRGPFGHARIRSIDTSAARCAAGVHAVYTAADLSDFNQLRANFGLLGGGPVRPVGR